jgi:multidrug efflux pump subunit AcrA (membrane-fusion protein)
VGALLVPQKAVAELQGHNQVAVVGSDNKVSVRNVQVGDRVVTDGTMKARDGSVVTPRPVTVNPEGK